MARKLSEEEARQFAWVCRTAAGGLKAGAENEAGARRRARAELAPQEFEDSELSLLLDHSCVGPGD